MRFARRSIGIKESRKIFFRSRKSRSCTYQVYVAAAQIEQHVNKDPTVSRKIYELGLRKFVNSTGFLLQYINFLVNLGDDVNARALFEKVLSTIPAERAPEIWNAFQKFETLCGNLDTIIKLEKKTFGCVSDIRSERNFRTGAEIPFSRFMALFTFRTFLF